MLDWLRRSAGWPLSAAAIFVAATGLGFFEASTQGVAWAENDYLDHLDGIRGWFAALPERGIAASVSGAPGRDLGVEASAYNQGAPFWEVGRVWNFHPPLYKYLALGSRWALPSAPFPEAERLPIALCFAGACVAIFLAVGRRRGLGAGLVAAFALASSPRFTSYAGIGTPDLPVACGLLWTVLAFERFMQTQRRRWLLLSCLAFSFALGSKLSALTVLPALGLLSLVWRYRGGVAEVLKGAAWVATIGAVGALALVALYPFLWPAPVERLALLLQETRTWGMLHPFSAQFFGKAQPYVDLPLYFGPAILALTTPPLTLALALAGALAPRDRDPLWQTAVALAAFWLLLVLVPGTPKYDNERHLLPLMPFLAILAGLGAADLGARLRALTQARSRTPLRALLGGGALLAMSLELAGAHPFPMSYFSPLVGGLPGAVRLGFEPTYALEVLNRGVVSQLEAALPQGAGVSLLPARSILPFLQRRGMLRADLRVSDAEGPFFVLVNRHTTAGHGGDIVRAHGTLVLAIARDDVPLVELWHLPPR